ncbi:MAG: hypothetical protein FWG32_06465 [Oscillospiraceae bacterium]|nr:hypothetical protein [Oscillospiraceae bacterium]
MRQKKFAGGPLDAVKDNIFPILLFAGIVVIFIFSLNNAKESSAAEERRIAEESIRRAVVSCYAIEGTYPESYEYIKENYKVRIDEKKFFIRYEVFASNIMPEFRIVEVGG